MDADPPSNLWPELLLLLFLVLCNAFFAASEIAILSLNDTKVRKLAEDGNRRAKKLLALTADSSNFLATIQIGVTLAGFLTSATAAQSLAAPLTNWFVAVLPTLAPKTTLVHTVSVVLITLLMSYFSLVFGELVPKRIAMQKAESLAFFAIGILKAVSVIFRPFVRLLSVSTNLVVRLCGIDPHADAEPVTEEEILMMVDAGEEKGVIEGSQKEMINNIFEFDDIFAEEIMTPRTDVFAADVEDSVEDVLRIAVDEGYSRIPVYEEDIDHIIGVLYIKDLLPYVGRPVPQGVTVRQLVRETYFVPGTKRCGALFSEMTEKRMQMCVVVDEYGGVAGIVTMEDLLEAIVGNIQDEFDHEKEDVTKIGENAFEVDGSMQVDELNEHLDIHIPEGEYDTVAGFIMDQLGRIPEEDEHPEVQFENVTFRVLKMDDRRIESVHVKVTPLPEESDEKNE